MQDVPNEAATSKVYKESLQLNRKKTLKIGKKAKDPTKRWANGDFPDGPVLRNPPSNAEDTSSGTDEIPHALGQLSQLRPQPRPNKTETKQKRKNRQMRAKRHFSKKHPEGQQAYAEVPRFTNSGKRKLKFTARHHYTPARMAVIKPPCAFWH